MTKMKKVEKNKIGKNIAQLKLSYNAEGVYRYYL